jgi:hypothetical protein
MTTVERILERPELMITGLSFRVGVMEATIVIDDHGCRGMSKESV